MFKSVGIRSGSTHKQGCKNAGNLGNRDPGRSDISKEDEPVKLKNWPIHSFHYKFVQFTITLRKILEEDSAAPVHCILHV